MLKSALLWASTNPFMAQRLPRYGFVRRATRRFMPGEALEDALDAATRLQGGGFGTLVTELGENVDTAQQARKVVDDYLRAAEAIRERGLDCEISIKPTHLGMDQGIDVAIQNTLDVAKAAGGVCWIDMEYSNYVDATLELYRGVRDEVENVGLCLQSYLRRTPADLDSLMEFKPNIRLVKGAYMEPPEVAFPKKGEVDGAYRKLASKMIRERKSGRMGRVCLGTHDDRMLGDAARVAYELEMGKDAYEVAMLYGIRSEAQAALVRKGVPTRVLISYGAHWFPWYMRRLAERPANIGFVMKSMFKK